MISISRDPIGSGVIATPSGIRIRPHRVAAADHISRRHIRVRKERDSVLLVKPSIDKNIANQPDRRRICSEGPVRITYRAAHRGLRSEIVGRGRPRHERGANIPR
jgi:hypothetical protein